MYVIAGLGNPGKKYEKTRHNAGFMTMDRLSDKLNISVTKEKFNALIGEGYIGSQKVILVKPQTYMNLSGDAVSQVMNFYKVELEDLIVIYDDIDLSLGSLRIRKSGSAGTHNGMRSIVSALHGDKFPRIRVGIGGSGDKDLVDHVIGNFGKEEAKVIEDIVDKAADAAICWVRDGIDISMNRYNTSTSKKKKRVSENGEQDN